MAQEYGVSQKTIRRDLDALATSGFPLIEKVGAHGKKFWRVQSPHTEAALRFNYDELVALYLGRRFLEPLAGTTFATAAQDAFRKIRSTLSDDAVDYLQTLAAAVHRTTFGSGDYSRHADVLDALLIGVEEQRVVRVEYHSLSSDGPKSAELHPYGLVFHRDALYLLAFAPAHDELRHYKVNRVLDAGVLRKCFEKPDDFDLQRHFEESFGVFVENGPAVTVKVRFDQEVARFVEESTWHPSQRVERHDDGGLTATFELVGTEEVQGWVLSFGRHAEVLTPPELRSEIAEELASALVGYATSPSTTGA